jgi:hypothetical protein
MKPGWSDVLRFAPETTLRVELVLKPALREAVERASADAAWCLQAMDGALLRIRELSAVGCRLHGSAAGGSLDVAADGRDLQAQVELPGRSHGFRLAGLLLQTGGTRDAYVAQAHETGAASPVPLVHLRYGADPGAVSVVMFSAGLADRVPPRYRAWLPARVELLRLVACAPAQAPASHVGAAGPGSP